MEVNTSYLQWEPILKPEELYKNSIGFGHTQTVDGKLFWIETRPEEGGRAVLVTLENENIKELTPRDYYIRTRVHEYGGKSFLVTPNNIFFVNFKDQRIYKQNLDNLQNISPLTPESNADGSVGKYAGFDITPDFKFLIFVYEKEFTDKENGNYIGYLDLGFDGIQEAKILHQGSDFYGAPKISPNGMQIAFTTWDHPNMPWDTTKLILLDFIHGKLIDQLEIQSPTDSSICLPLFNLQNELFFVMDVANKDENDYRNWWNFYKYDKSSGSIITITQELVEFADPAWLIDNNSYTFFSDTKLITKYTSNGSSNFAIVDTQGKDVQYLNLNKISYIAYPSVIDSENIIFIGGGPKLISSVFTYNISLNKLVTLKTSKFIDVSEENIPQPKFIEFKSGNVIAKAFFYSPINSNYQQLAGELPPLKVMIHGGPTGKTNPIYSLYKNYWTSAGFAILDLDYIGSTGYGRKYRDGLKINWGVVDMENIKDAVELLVQEGKVDKTKITISGGSAGGYAVQRILTLYPNLFAAGASYYGVADLLELAKTTHKFESRYLDSLMNGDVTQAIETYVERSPINHIEKIKTPMVLFQGSEDKIVPPEQSRMIYKLLLEKGIKTKYFEYEGEGHGFRNSKNNVDAIIQEKEFYKEVFIQQE
ncbi:MAG: prolyl oligopeptidase family serine peptidase [Candidatus Heimdallarchaeota archaeon]|nr:prolyl oligopeptidase family serine peptidase [Candidatus Heimdallarchaeota archaeon]